MKIRCVFFFCILSQYLFAQTGYIQDSIYSDVLNEERLFRVYLAKNDPPDNTEFDVLYVLDGEDTGDLAAMIRKTGEDDEFFPPFIIVAIQNRWWPDFHFNSRDRDFLPMVANEFPISGGADQFLVFLKEELIPYINKKYPSNGVNTLFGHSYGGLFVMYTLLTQPMLFDSYIASDPSFWWNKGYINHLAKQKLDDFPDTRRTLFLGGREGKINKAFGHAAMDSILQVHAPENLIWKSVAFPNEHHGSVQLINMYYGLKFTYFGYTPFVMDFFPKNGIIIPGKPISVKTFNTYLDYDPGIRYTLDGTIPSGDSPRFEYGITIAGTTDFTLKLFSTRGNDLIIRSYFKEGKVLPSVPKPVMSISGGFNYTYFKGHWDSLPDFGKLIPVKSGRLNDNFYLDNFGKENFACLIEGNLEIEKDGYYTFFFNADEKAKFFIGSQLLIDTKTDGGKTDLKSFLVPLERGFYPVKIEYFHKEGNPFLHLMYLRPQDEGELFSLPMRIPTKLQYSR